VTGVYEIPLKLAALAELELELAHNQFSIPVEEDGMAVVETVDTDDELPSTNSTPYSSVSRLTFAEDDPHSWITTFEAQSQYTVSPD